MNRIGIGIVGTGIAARELHVPTLRALPDLYEITAIADTSMAKSQHMLELTPEATPYDDYRKLIGDDRVELVDVVVPVPYHEEIAREAIRQGKHVLVEKPITATVDQADTLLSIKKASGRVAMVAENFIYRNAVRKLSSLAADGSIGRVRAVLVDFAALIPASSPYASTGWRVNPEFVGNFIVDVGIHHMSMVHYICGMPLPGTALVQSINPALGGIDGISLHFTTSDDVLCSMNLFLSATGISHDRVTLIGEKGSIVGEQPGPVFGEYTISVFGNEGPQTFDFTDDTGYVLEFTNLYEAIREGAEPVSTFERGRADLAALLLPIQDAIGSQG